MATRRSTTAPKARRNHGPARLASEPSELEQRFRMRNEGRAVTARVEAVVKEWEQPESMDAILAGAGEEGQRDRIKALLRDAEGASAKVGGALGDLALWHRDLADGRRRTRHRF